MCFLEETIKMTLKIHFPYTVNDQFLLIDVEHNKLLDAEGLHDQRLPNHSFILKTKGNGTITIDGVAHRTSRDVPLIIHAPKRSILTIACTESLEYYRLSYQVRPNPARLVEPSIFVLEPGNILPLYEKADQLIESFHAEEPIVFQSVALFYNFLAYIWKELLAEEAKPILDVADQVIEWIDYRYKEQITLEDLSKVFQYSIKHLSRLVKRQTGMSPIQYLIHVRMEKAKTMLENTDAKLNEIAKRTGYNDLFYFSNHFKKNIGISPTEYRKRSMKSQEAINRKSRKSMSIATESSYNLIEIDYQLRRDLLFMIKRFGFKPYLIRLLCFVLVLQACGNKEGEGVEEEDSSNEKVAEENEGFPRTVEDHEGIEVVLEEQPERIVVSSFFHVDYLISLGITPIAGAGTSILDVLKEWESFDAYQEELAKIEQIGETDAIDMEKLVELEPDLIIEFTAGKDDQFAQIAPVASIGFNEAWQDKLRLYAELTGKEDEAEDLIEGLEAEIAETRDSLDYDPEDTVVLLFNDWFILNYEHIFDKENGLGLNAPESYPKQTEQSSLEGLVDMNPDYLLIVEGTKEKYEEIVNTLNDSEAWQTTNAAQNDEIHYVNRAAQTSSPLGFQYTLNRMKEIFGEK